MKGAASILLSLALAVAAAPAAAQPALRARMLTAEDQRASSDADLAPLRQGLRSGDADTRRQAVRGIGRLERPELMRLVSPLLTDANADVRIETANAIAQLARGPEGVAAAKSRLLTRVRGEQTPRVRGAIAAALGRLAYASAADVQDAERTLAAMLPPASETQRSAVVNLDEIAGAVEGLEALIRQAAKLARPSTDTIARLRGVATIEGRAQDAEVLARIKRLSRAALIAANGVTRPLLEGSLEDPDDEVRRLTMIAARADIEGRDAVVTRGLSDREPRVRYEALQTWGRILQKESCAPIVRAVNDPNPHVMLLAIDLLGNGCPPSEAASSVPLVRLARPPGAGSADWHAAAHAIVALAKARPAEARPLVRTFASHTVWQVRMYAAHAAGALQAGDVLETLARDASDNVREAALAELATMKSATAVPLALEALTRRDYQLLITAARAVAPGATEPRVVPALLAALARVTAEKRENSRDARLALLTRLDEISPNGAPAGGAEALRSYLRDFDPAVASKAAAVLQKWIGAATTAAPQRLPPPAVALADAEALRHVTLRFVMAGKGHFDLRLLVDDAPLSSLRVAGRAREGYYNGLTFHRVVPNFVIQGGSPGANEYVGDAAFMRDEVGLARHRRGTVGISTRGRDTGDAQIFVNLVDLPRLNHIYTVFADVIAGMDVVDAILEGDVIERVEVISGAPASH